jgi:peroxiredoxin
MLQLSGGIALAGMAGCIGRGDEEAERSSGDTKDEDSSIDDETKKRAKTGEKAPEFELETPDGEKVKLDSGGKPTVVLFADVTSEAAKSHSRTLVDFHEEHADHARVITVNSDLDVSKDDVRAFHEAYGGDWECAMGDADVLETYGVNAAVALFVVDEHGDLAARLEAETTADGLRMFLDAYAES